MWLFLGLDGITSLERGRVLRTVCPSVLDRSQFQSGVIAMAFFFFFYYIFYYLKQCLHINVFDHIPSLPQGFPDPLHLPTNPILNYFSKHQYDCKSPPNQKTK